MARLVLPARTTCRDLVSPSVTWALGIELRFCPEDGKHLSLMNLLPTGPHPELLRAMATTSRYCENVDIFPLTGIEGLHCL